MRLLISMLCALGLAIAPTAANAASASSMPGCTMDGHMPGKPTNHSKMDCCTPACQTSAAAALLPDRAADESPLANNDALHDRAAVQEPASFSASGLDPPPRA